jgi:hypothetical protein
MAIGILGKALAGAGAAVQPVALEGLRASILAERDARLNQYATNLETNVRQPFQTAERIAGETFSAGESEKTRTAEAPLKEAQVGGVKATTSKINAELSVIRETEALYKKYMATTDPKEKASIAEAMRVRLGKDQDNIFFGPIKDDLGNVIDYKAYSKITGKPMEQEIGDKTDANDPLGLRSGGASSVPTTEKKSVTGTYPDREQVKKTLSSRGGQATDKDVDTKMGIIYGKSSPQEPEVPKPFEIGALASLKETPAPKKTTGLIAGSLESQFLTEPQGGEGIPGLARSAGKAVKRGAEAVSEAIQPAPAYVQTDSGKQRLHPGETIRINNKDYRVEAPSADGVWRLVDISSGKAINIRTSGENQ